MGDITDICISVPPVNDLVHSCLPNRTSCNDNAVTVLYKMAATSHTWLL